MDGTPLVGALTARIATHSPMSTAPVLMIAFEPSWRFSALLRTLGEPTRFRSDHAAIATRVRTSLSNVQPSPTNSRTHTEGVDQEHRYAGALNALSTWLGRQGQALRACLRPGLVRRRGADRAHRSSPLEQHRLPLGPEFPVQPGTSPGGAGSGSGASGRRDGGSKAVAGDRRCRSLMA